jgi:hypothetical protein
MYAMCTGSPPDRQSRGRALHPRCQGSDRRTHLIERLVLSWLGGHHPPRRRMVGRDVGDDLYTPSAEIAPQRFEQSQALGIEAEAYEVRAVGGGPGTASSWT